jgi:hypothetical protein
MNTRRSVESEITVTWRTTTYGLDRSTSIARRPLSWAWIESARACSVTAAPLAPRLDAKINAATTLSASGESMASANRIKASRVPQRLFSLITNRLTSSVICGGAVRREIRIASVIDLPVANVVASERTQRSSASSNSMSRGFGRMSK